jgi:cbb3-type cytochrome oxidase maturation protein
MDVLYLLIPLSVVLVLVLIALFGWALSRGQFDDLEQQGAAILETPDEALDRHQAP